MEKWVCNVCGYFYDGALPVDLVCSSCSQSLANVEEKPLRSKNPHIGTNTERTCGKSPLK
jgi:hypothetical protein